MKQAHKVRSNDTNYMDGSASQDLPKLEEEAWLKLSSDSSTTLSTPGPELELNA